jgi:uncharacterized phage protein (TIGR02216 family)
MAVGLGQLRLAPAVLWAMTPREFEAAVRGAFGHEASVRPIVRADLEALMGTYPDT